MHRVQNRGRLRRDRRPLFQLPICFNSTGEIAKHAQSQANAMHAAKKKRTTCASHPVTPLTQDVFSSASPILLISLAMLSPVPFRSWSALDHLFSSLIGWP